MQTRTLAVGDRNQKQADAPDLPFLLLLLLQGGLPPGVGHRISHSRLRELLCHRSDGASGGDRLHLPYFPMRKSAKKQARSSSYYCYC